MNNPRITRIGAVVFQAVIVLIGIGMLTVLLAGPHFEGRNADATVFAIYFKDPFLSYVYLASVFFFTTLYQAFILCAYAARNALFSAASVKALRKIRNCALTLVVFALGAEVFIVLLRDGSDDIAGGVAMGLLVLSVSAGAAIAATVMERFVKKRGAIL